MENLKIKVNSEAESKEAQELFFELGYEWYAHGKNVSYLDVITTGDFGYLVAWKTGCFSKHIIQMGCGKEDAKEITLPQLRDMVVLKRNSVEDATHENAMYSYIELSDGWYYFDKGESNKWLKSTGGKPKYYKKLKPIQKEKTMKEWIYKDGSGEYVLTTDPEVANLAADAVEVPCGANKLTKFGLCLYFWNTVNNTTYVDGTGWQPCDNDSLCTFESYIMDSDVHVIWQRQPNQTTIDAMNDDKTEAFDTKEMVNHPEHYNKHPSGIECIDIARHHDFAIGSAIKYLWRAGLKESDNEIQDLKKAVFYIQDKIKQLESKNVDNKTIDWIDEGNK